jgi:hypothetical protein
MDPFSQGLQMGLAHSAAAAAGSGRAAAAALGHQGGSSGLGQQLPPALAGDPMLSAAHDQHMRQMLLLNMELDRAKTSAELQQVRSQLSQLQVNSGAAGEWGVVQAEFYH